MLDVVIVPFSTLHEVFKPSVLEGYFYGCECGESYTKAEYASTCKKCRQYLIEPATKVYMTPLC